MIDNSGQPIDLYCERLTAAFWAEPVNALTNFAFILAAILAYGLLRDKNPKPASLKILTLLAAIVGIGSFIFHTTATKGAMMFDVIPIVIFIHYALFLIYTRIFGLKWWLGIIGVIAFLTFNTLFLSALGRTLFNGSIQYVPTFLLLLVVAIFCRKKEFYIAAFTFLIALTCRSIDNQICPTFPLGTHFIWHILNAVVMYYVMKALIKIKN